METKIHKLKFILLTLFLVFIYSSAAKALASEQVFLQMDIKEEKIGSLIQFSLDSADILYGDYGNLIDFYDEEMEDYKDYTLTTFNAEKHELDKYFLDSSRFILWDDFENQTGGVDESDSGIISVFIPHNDDNPVAFIKIKINENEKETEFIPLPADELKSQFEQINYCKKENELGYYDTDKCCSEFVPADYAEGWFACVNNQDGECSEYENYWSSPNDCEIPTRWPQNPILRFALKIWSWLLAGISFPFRFLRALF